jgi:peroxiredoxin Q/BCP
LVQLQSQLESLQVAGIQLAGVSPDSVEILRTFSEQYQIDFPLLSDPQSQTIEAFGILAQRGLPHPGTIVVDGEGVIRAKIFRAGYRDRHPVEELIETVRQLEK